jgi:hypothetical protein
MRKFLILTCCVGLASLVGAAEHDNNNQQKKKKGNTQAQPQQQQVVTPQTGKKYKTGPGGGPHHLQNQNLQQQGAGKHGKKWQGPVTGQGNVSGNVSNNAANTKFNKSNKHQKFGQGNMANATGGGNAMKFQKKHFNLQTNNTQFVVNKYKTVNYNKNYKFVGFYGGNPHNWGSKYVVFANYSPVWHDTWWWNWHHPHVSFIFGGWYYWDNYYWYPAWGYAPNSVYVYDGPIYASSPAEDPGQVVANVQAALQQQGYYQGDIDGVLGPQTRAALAEYQSAQGLEPTGAVDEPTLETLGMV